MIKKLRGYLLTGLVVWLPIFITFLVISSIVEWLDKLVSLLPHAYQPNTWFGITIPGIGVFIFIALFVFTGLFVTHLIGQKFIELGESLLKRIPLVRVIYQTTKQIIQALLITNDQSFRQVVMIEYPRKGAWTMAFLTGKIPGNGLVSGADKLCTIYVPTTPNPTSGFFLMVPENEVILLAISVEDALKIILSLGVMQQPLFRIKSEGVV
jgi:uncharacterized membrane protein